MLNNFTLLVSIYKKNNIIEIIKLIKSIKSQTLYPAEIIFIYDGHVSLEIHKFVEKLKNVKIIRNKKNKGLGYSLRKGVISSKYSAIIRCDADDINLSSRFEILYKTFIRHGNLDVIGSLQQETYHNNHYIRSVPECDTKIKKILSFRNCINHPTVLLSKKTVIKSGNYENVGKYLSCNNFEDYYLWLKMRKINANFNNYQKILIRSHVDKKFFERRNSKELKKNYKLFLKKCYKNKLLSKYEVWINYIIRTTIYKLPIKYFIYFVIYFLRVKIRPRVINSKV